MMTEGALCEGNPGKQQRDATLVKMRMDGETLSRIGNKLGYSKGHLSRLLNHDKDIKALITEASKCQAAMLPKALERHADILSSADTDNKDLLKAIQMTYQNTGIQASHAQPQVIQNIMIHQQNVLDPTLLQGFGRWFLDDVEDAEIVPTIEQGPDTDKGNDTSG